MSESATLLDCHLAFTLKEILMISVHLSDLYYVEDYSR